MRSLGPIALRTTFFGAKVGVAVVSRPPSTPLSAGLFDEEESVMTNRLLIPNAIEE
jgi:hypothetical protein